MEMTNLLGMLSHMKNTPRQLPHSQQQLSPQQAPRQVPPQLFPQLPPRPVMSPQQPLYPPHVTNSSPQGMLCDLYSH